MKPELREPEHFRRRQWLLLSANACLLILFVLSVAAIEMADGFTPYSGPRWLSGWPIRRAASVIFWICTLAGPPFYATTVARYLSSVKPRHAWFRFIGLIVLGELVAWCACWAAFIGIFWPAILNGLHL